MIETVVLPENVGSNCLYFMSSSVLMKEWWRIYRRSWESKMGRSEELAVEGWEDDGGVGRTGLN